MSHISFQLFHLIVCFGQVVSILAFYSDDLSSNPAEAYSFSEKLCLKWTKINKKYVLKTKPRLSIKINHSGFVCVFYDFILVLICPRIDVCQDFFEFISLIGFSNKKCWDDFYFEYLLPYTDWVWRNCQD